MNGEISFRHNVINIQSLDTFIHIRGGFYHGRKDVYFVRAIGECPDFLKVFETLDGKLIEAEKSNRIRYLRIKSLPNSVEKQASEYYVSAYAEWKQGKPIITGKRSENKNFVSVLDKATRETIEKYKIVRPGLSESIIRNFVIKLWYWTDLFPGDVIREWSERLTVKIVSDNIVKPQEYLFFYFATLLGFDVLLFNNRADIEMNEKVRNLSSELILGSYGTAELPEHGKNTVCTQENKAESSRRHIDPVDRKNEFPRIKKNEKNEFPKKQGDKKYFRAAVTIGTRFEDSSLMNGQTYIYKVCAYTGIGGVEYFGQFSENKKVTTYAPQPANLDAAQLTKNSISLNWSAMNNAVSYKVYKYDAAAGKYMKIATTKTNSYVDLNVQPGVVYKYRLYATMRENNGVVYTILTATKAGIAGPGKVTGFSVDNSTPGSLRFNWVKAPGVSKYQIFYAIHNFYQ